MRGVCRVAALFDAMPKRLTEPAKKIIPKLREGESIIGESLGDGRYCRVTMFQGQKILMTYRFKTRTVESCVESEEET